MECRIRPSSNLKDCSDGLAKPYCSVRYRAWCASNDQPERSRRNLDRRTTVIALEIVIDNVLPVGSVRVVKRAASFRSWTSGQASTLSPPDRVTDLLRWWRWGPCDEDESGIFFQTYWNQLRFVASKLATFSQLRAWARLPSSLMPRRDTGR